MQTILELLIYSAPNNHVFFQENDSPPEIELKTKHHTIPLKQSTPFFQTKLKTNSMQQIRN